MFACMRVIQPLRKRLHQSCPRLGENRVRFVEAQCRSLYTRIGPSSSVSFQGGNDGVVSKCCNLRNRVYARMQGCQAMHAPPAQTRGHTIERSCLRESAPWQSASRSAAVNMMT